MRYLVIAVPDDEVERFTTIVNSEFYPCKVQDVTVPVLAPTRTVTAEMRLDDVNGPAGLG
jgi:hypothetical protein